MIIKILGYLRSIGYVSVIAIATTTTATTTIRARSLPLDSIGFYEKTPSLGF